MQRSQSTQRSDPARQRVFKNNQKQAITMKIKIETKFSVGDKPFLYDYGRGIVQVMITVVCVEFAGEGEATVMYKTTDEYRGSNWHYREEALFATVDEAKAYVLENTPVTMLGEDDRF